MAREITITSEYFSQYRRSLGFTTQSATKNFFGAKDITPTVDFKYIAILNGRLEDIVDRINSVVVDKVKIKDISAFRQEHIYQAFAIMKKITFYRCSIIKVEDLNRFIFLG